MMCRLCQARLSIHVPCLPDRLFRVAIARSRVFVRLSPLPAFPDQQAVSSAPTPGSPTSPVPFTEVLDEMQVTCVVGGPDKCWAGVKQRERRTEND